MKTKLLLATCILLICNRLSIAQTTPYYTFTQFTSAYSNLTATTSINNSAVWNFSGASPTPYYTLSITSLLPGFQLFGDAAYNMRIFGGAVAFYDNSSQQLHYINGFNLISPDGMKDKGTTSSLSPISYVVTGASPNKILKVEWKNAGHVNTAGDVINVQIWMYQTTNVVEVHYGSTTFTNASSTPISIGIGHTYVPNGNVVEDDFLMNTPSNPVLSTTNNIFTGIPANGVVYKFAPGSVGINELNKPLQGIKIFPNPATGKFTIDVKNVKEDLNRAKVIITNVIGEVILEMTLNNQVSTVIDLTNKPKGIYFIKLYNGKDFSSEKIILQ
jgi:hypothetical protein